jgi:hypothetical protein
VAFALIRLFAWAKPLTGCVARANGETAVVCSQLFAGSAISTFRGPWLHLQHRSYLQELGESASSYGVGPCTLLCADEGEVRNDREAVRPGVLV